MLARVNLRVEIIDGEDAGYVLEEQNKVMNFEESVCGDGVHLNPNRIVIEFDTPSTFRKRNMLLEAEKEIKEDDKEN